VLRGTTSRGLCGLVCPSRTSERGGEGYCAEGGGGEEGERERERAREVRLHYVCVYSCSTLLQSCIPRIPVRVCLSLQYLVQKLFAWEGGDMGGHVLRETTSRGLCGLGCPSRTSERGGEGDCVKEGGGGEGKCERERALERLRYYSPGH
jgi:hypothetical protein